MNYGIEINLELKLIDTVDNSGEDIIVKAARNQREIPWVHSSWKMWKNNDTLLIAD